MKPAYDAVVVGAGPNGLTAAAVLARAGRSVLVLEGATQIGGGTSSLPMTLPGFIHDHCSAVHPLGAASPAFRDLELHRHGLTWRHAEVAMAHPLDGGKAATVFRSVDETAEAMGPDGDAWRALVGRKAATWDAWCEAWLSPVLRLPSRPLTLARGAPPMALPATTLARRYFRGPDAKAAIAGFAGHVIAPLDRPPTGAAGVLFNAAAHAVGMPVAEGGSQAIADALAVRLRRDGGEILVGHPVASMADVPDADLVLFDLSPGSAAAIAGDALAPRVRRAFRRYRHGPASFKVDVALDGPVPWAAPACRRAASLHIGGTIEEVAASEGEVAAGRHPGRPFLIAAQPTVCDPSRAPAGKSILWAYCHVPAGSTVDMTERILGQVERFAPGFRDLVLATTSTSPADFERSNPNFVGGDIAGGSTRGRRAILRPRLALDPWRIGERLYLCSQSTPPGVGVHGMCGWWAAHAALSRRRR